MKTIAVRSANAFGCCVIIASLLSGCATQPDVERIPMTRQDLNYFRVDCSRKEEQIAMLQSMRMTNEEQFEAKLRLGFKFYERWTDPNAYDINRTMGGNVNKYVNHHLATLGRCP